MNYTKLKENINFYLNLLLITLLLFGGAIYADTNGLWTNAKDVRAGTFGADEGGGNYTFTDNVTVSKYVSATKYCNTNYEDCFDYNDILDLVPTCSGSSNPSITPGTIYNFNPNIIEMSDTSKALFTYHFGDTIFFDNDFLFTSDEIRNSPSNPGFDVDVVKVYSDDGSGNWVLTQEIYETDLPETDINEFGKHSISRSGDYLAVGSSDDKVFIFKYNSISGLWEYSQTLEKSGDSELYFGIYVSLVDDLLAISYIDDSTSFSSRDYIDNKVYIYELNSISNNWVEKWEIEVEALSPSWESSSIYEFAKGEIELFNDGSDYFLIVPNYAQSITSSIYKFDTSLNDWTFIDNLRDKFVDFEDGYYSKTYISSTGYRHFSPFSSKFSTDDNYFIHSFGISQSINLYKDPENPKIIHSFNNANDRMYTNAFSISDGYIVLHSFNISGYSNDYWEVYEFDKNSESITLIDMLVHPENEDFLSWNNLKVTNVLNNADTIVISGRQRLDQEAGIFIYNK